MRWQLNRLQRMVSESTSNPSADNISQLKQLVSRWDPNKYRRTRPKLWQEANDALFQARVLLNMYDKE
jgi:hypothetical protein